MSAKDDNVVRPSVDDKDTKKRKRETKATTSKSKECPGLSAENLAMLSAMKYELSTTHKKYLLDNFSLQNIPEELKAGFAADLARLNPRVYGIMTVEVINEIITEANNAAEAAKASGDKRRGRKPRAKPAYDWATRLETYLKQQKKA